MRQLKFATVLVCSLLVTVRGMSESPAFSPCAGDDAIVAKHSVLPNGGTVERDACLLLVSIAEQRMVFAVNGVPQRSYKVSTALAGTGSKVNSEKTPLGWHRVSEWIGDGCRPGQVFVSRRPTHEVIPWSCFRTEGGADYVLTRIMWLDGMEKGLNNGGVVDSHSRYIYIHGTNQEQLLGRPASHGCIRLSNRDVLELFALTRGRTTYCNVLLAF